jgi:hypothetical protein
MVRTQLPSITSGGQKVDKLITFYIQSQPHRLKHPSQPLISYLHVYLYETKNDNNVRVKLKSKGQLSDLTVFRARRLLE